MAALQVQRLLVSITFASLWSSTSLILQCITMLSTNLLLAAATAGLSGASEAQYLNATRGAGYISYSTVTGYFLQDEPDTVASGFDYVCFLSEIS